MVSFFVTQKGIKEKMAVIASLDLFLLTSKGWSDSICWSSSDESKRLRKQDKPTDGRSFDPSLTGLDWQHLMLNNQIGSEDVG